MVTNDPLLESKVVMDEPGRLGRPAERAGRAWPALAGQPGRPVPPAGRWAALQGNEGSTKEGTREERRRGGSAQDVMEPPHSYHRRWVI